MASKASSAGLSRRVALFLPPADLHVEADDAVLVAVADEGNAAIEIVLPLDDLLRTLRNVGGVREGEVIGELLLDGDLRAGADGIGFGGQSLRIDFDIAAPNKRWKRLLMVSFMAWLRMSALAWSEKTTWPDCSWSCADSWLVRPNARSAMMSDLGKGGSER